MSAPHGSAAVPAPAVSPPPPCGAPGRRRRAAGCRRCGCRSSGGSGCGRGRRRRAGSPAPRSGAAAPARPATTMKASAIPQSAARWSATEAPGREVVHVPVVAVVVGELRRGARRGHQLVDQRRRRSRASGGGEDLGEPAAYRRARPRRSLLGRASPTSLIVVLSHEACAAPRRPRARPRRVVLRCGVHQIDHGVERAPGVVGDQHDSLPGLGSGGRPPMPADA